MHPYWKKLQEKGISVYIHHIDGANALEKMLKAVLTGDFVSLYLAHLNGVDPASGDTYAIRNQKTVPDEDA